MVQSRYLCGMRVALLFFLSLFFSGASAQSKKQENAEAPAEAFYPQQDQAPKNATKKSAKATYDAQDKSEARMESNWKKREKKEKKFSRKMDTDYSMAPYFGHKRIPKIRPVGKRKLCKVCGLMH
jgi:hypothetical protein